MVMVDRCLLGGRRKGVVMFINMHKFEKKFLC